MTLYFEYDKRQVIQALRYHFISRMEIRVMIILVNVFTLASVILYMMHKITQLGFLVGSLLWIVLMISFWYVLPHLVYRRATTFQHAFSFVVEEEKFTLQHEHGGRTWPWTALVFFIESPHFFHLYYDSRSFLLLPKNAWENSDGVHEFRMFLKERVKKK